ncbi:hypothetical protein JCM37172_11720 [Faecalimonas hominis]
MLRIPLGLMTVTGYEKGIAGHEVVAIFDNIKVLKPTGNAQYQGFQILMSGKGCRNYENFLQLNGETWFDFLNRVCQYHINFPRIDLAIDDRKPYLSIPDLIVRTKEGLLSSKLREIDFHDSGELKEEVFQSKGGSLYLGSSASNLRLVFYEKGYEQNKKYGTELDENWNRYELRFRQEMAVSVVQELLKYRDVAGLAMEVLNSKIRFLEKPTDSTTTRKRLYPTYQAWAELMKDIGKVTLITSDLTFEQVRVFSEALTTDELNNAAEPANDNVVLWLNFDGRLEDDIATDVDKRMLEALVDYCLSLESGDYLEAGWSAMQKPLETAKTVLADKQVTRKEVADAEKALSEAKEALVYVKDLKDAIDVADKEIVPNKDKYTKDSYKVFSDALKEAKAIRNKKDATQAEVNKAKITLLDAQNALVNIADKSDLSKAIKDAEQLLKKESLTPSSEQELKAAIEAAKKVNDDENATQEAVDAATEALKEAMGAIRTMADFKELEKTVNRIDEMKLDKYTEESVQILKKALADAKAVLANKESTQKEVDDALSTLLAAEKGLVKKQDGGNNGGNNGGSNGGNNQNNGNHGNPNRPVKTGDTSPVMAFGLAAVATGLAGAVAMYTKRRKRS